MLWPFWWELVPNSQNLLVIYGNVWKLMEAILEISYKSIVSYLHFKLIPIFVTMSQVLHRSARLGSTLFCTQLRAGRLHFFQLGSGNSRSAPLCSAFLWSWVFCSALLRSQAARLQRWVTRLCFPTRAKSLGAGLVGLGSGFLTVTQRLREFLEVAGREMKTKLPRGDKGKKKCN